MKKVIYPGTFDPLHYGHIDITKRAAKLFDEVHICISDNLHKNPLFSHKERMDMIEECVHDIDNVYVHSNPKNLVIRFSSPMVDQGPVNSWPNTSTVSTKSRTCPAPDNNNECGSCRACWDPEVKNIDHFTMEDIKLENYVCHDAIKAKMAV